MNNELCWYDGSDTTSVMGPRDLDGNWYIRCHCGWEYDFEYSEENYLDAIERLTTHRGPNPNIESE